jgi:hypothetical protein
MDKRYAQMSVEERVEISRLHADRRPHHRAGAQGGRRAYVSVYSFSNKLLEVTGRHGFAPRDAIGASQAHNGTYFGRAIEQLKEEYERLIVMTGEQAHASVPGPRGAGYMIKVGSYKNGVGYGKLYHIDGWSESVIEYIRALEATSKF